MSLNLLPIQVEPAPRGDLTLMGGEPAAPARPSPAGRDFEGFLRQALNTTPQERYTSAPSVSPTALSSEQYYSYHETERPSESFQSASRSQEWSGGSAQPASGERGTAASQPERDTAGAGGAPAARAGESGGAASVREPKGSPAESARSQEPRASSSLEPSRNTASGEGAPARKAEASGEQKGGASAGGVGVEAGLSAAQRAALVAKATQELGKLAEALGLSLKQKEALLREIATANAATLKRLIAEWNALRTGGAREPAAKALVPNEPKAAAKAVTAEKTAKKGAQEAMQATMAPAALHAAAHHAQAPQGPATLLPVEGQGLPPNQTGREGARIAAVHPNASNQGTTTIIDLRGSAGSQTHTGGSPNQQSSSGPNQDAGSARLIQLVAADSAGGAGARPAPAVSAGPAFPTGSFQQQFQSIADQLVRQTGILLKDSNAGEIRLLLKPENLGSVRIRIDMVDNSLTGRILVDNNQIAKLIQQNLDALYQGFRESGFTQTSLSVSVGGKHAGEREKGRHSPLPAVARIAGARRLEGSVPSVDFVGSAYSFVNLVV